MAAGVDLPKRGDTQPPGKEDSEMMTVKGITFFQLQLRRCRCCAVTSSTTCPRMVAPYASCFAVSLFLIFFSLHYDVQPKQGSKCADGGRKLASDSGGSCGCETKQPQFVPRVSIGSCVTRVSSPDPSFLPSQVVPGVETGNPARLEACLMFWFVFCATLGISCGRGGAY